MTTWATFRDLTIRYLLKDVASTKTWSDAELLAYANWGIRDLALVTPDIKNLALTGSGPEYALPTDFLTLQRLTLVENGQTTFIPPLTPIPGNVWPFSAPTDSSTPVGYLLDWPQQGAIYLTQLETSGAYTLYYTAWPVELTGNTDVLPYTYRRWAEQALACYICYCAHLREGVGRAALEQWSQRPDNLVKNPQNIEAAEWLKAYDRLVTLHRGRGN